MTIHHRIALLAGSLLGLSFACSTGECIVGSEGCTCSLASGACEQGLTCVSNMCVSPSDDDVGDATDTVSETDTSSESGSETDTTSGLPVCGDGLAEGDEACDGEDLAGQTCVSLGYTLGELACRENCTLDQSGCYVDAVCGNGTREGNEECDGDDLDGLTCANIDDFVGGELACNEDCSLLVYACLVVGEGESCDSDADCEETAPNCVDGACWNGSEGDPCNYVGECPDASCVNNQCWDGSEGDPCNNPTDCSEFVLFCVEHLCQTGEPGSPCVINADCVSDSCDVDTFTCL
ncbi:hypothetical protein G6O69_13595 [Pseudenhygromyxa sp. WMMC2535]|uniref:hypothetical protein n=1 Tax=Pseudenhygromyxa sp. WMMC2535 TaxID=2712867 RepID=UPI001553B68C|nr:hypothetical protein [Pseudenhygromyxa sp. WMMC2535]NVB38870.1 hypothetical protein [Pseudenhygromyxa sp. WMMC2535]